MANLWEGRGRRAWAATALATAIVLLGSAGERPALAQSALSLAPAEFRQLAGWSDDRLAAALPAFLRSCAHIERQPDLAPLDPAAGGEFGRIADWKPLCHEAAALPPGDDGAARAFFERRFVPALARGGSGSVGLITAYWEVETTGSRLPQGSYRVPVYRTPPGLAERRGRLTRQQIEGGALAGQGLEILYLADEAQLRTLQTQGSGLVHLTDGATVRLGYDANNGIGPIGNEPPYVFFRENHGDGPVGAEGAGLTPGRSLAVDHRFVPFGMPLWLEARGRYDGTVLHHLVIAQDTGDGIAGPVRGDFYVGSGPAAAAFGSRFLADGGYYLLLPRSLAMRLVAAN